MARGPRNRVSADKKTAARLLNVQPPTEENVRNEHGVPAAAASEEMVVVGREIRVWLIKATMVTQSQQRQAGW